MYLGIDTSNYKTSIALIDESSKVIYERSELLEVKEGRLGLRQSEAFYQHSMRMPGYIRESIEHAGTSEIKAIAYSAWPRRRQGSYMPCFNAGINAAKILSSSLRVPAYPVSHQEGHAAAVIPDDENDRTLFMHLSGGTSEFLVINPGDTSFEARIAGGTKDISFGQLLDRAGVAMGYPFPAGKPMDDLCISQLTDSASTDFVFPRIIIDNGYFNLSGAETKLLKYIEKNNINSKATDTAQPLIAGMFKYIADILIKSAEFLLDKYGLNTAYMAGGVASSMYIRQIINNCDIDIKFGDPVLSGDNAVGVARLARRMNK